VGRGLLRLWQPNVHTYDWAAAVQQRSNSSAAQCRRAASELADNVGICSVPSWGGAPAKSWPCMFVWHTAYADDGRCYCTACRQRATSCSAGLCATAGRGRIATRPQRGSKVTAICYCSALSPVGWQPWASRRGPSGPRGGTAGAGWIARRVWLKGGPSSPCHARLWARGRLLHRRYLPQPPPPLSLSLSVSQSLVLSRAWCGAVRCRVGGAVSWLAGCRDGDSGHQFAPRQGGQVECAASRR